MVTAETPNRPASSVTRARPVLRHDPRDLLLAFAREDASGRSAVFAVTGDSVCGGFDWLRLRTLCIEVESKVKQFRIHSQHVAGSRRAMLGAAPCVRDSRSDAGRRRGPAPCRVARGLTGP